MAYKRLWILNRLRVLYWTAQLPPTTTAEETKLSGIETGADVTDTDNVRAANALMDDELTSLSGVKTLTVPDSTTISTFAATLLDDTTDTAARSTLGVDAAGTDNSTDVTLAGTLGYLTLSGQEITVGAVDLSTDVTGSLPATSLSGTIDSARLPDLVVSDFDAAAIVTEADDISSNDNDTTIPTSAAVKDYVDSATGGGGITTGKAIAMAIVFGG